MTVVIVFELGQFDLELHDLGIGGLLRLLALRQLALEVGNSRLAFLFAQEVSAQPVDGCSHLLECAALLVDLSLKTMQPFLSDDVGHVGRG